MASPRLVVIGASYLQVPLVVAARRMSVETHVFAWEEGAVARTLCDRFYPISILEKDAILAEARRIGADGVATIASDLAAVTVNYVAERLGLPGNPDAITPQTTDKGVMRRVLTDAELPCPGFVVVDDGIPPEVEDLRPPLIVKPTDRSGSRGVSRVPDIAHLEIAVERARGEALRRKVVIEEFIEGTEVSIETLSWDGAHYHLAITDKETSGPPYFVEIGQHQPSLLPPEVQHSLIDLNARALTALGIRVGASHSEWLVTPEGRPYIVEIGARMGGDFIGSDLVRLSTGYDFLEGVVNAALGQFHGVDQPLRCYAGVRYVHPAPGIVTAVEDRCGEYPEILKREVFVTPGDRVPVLRQSSERVAYYIYQGEMRFMPQVPPIQIHTKAARRLD